jgi:hypothetical protein
MLYNNTAGRAVFLPIHHVLNMSCRSSQMTWLLPNVRLTSNFCIVVILMGNRSTDIKLSSSALQCQPSLHPTHATTTPQALPQLQHDKSTSDDTRTSSALQCELCLHPAHNTSAPRTHPQIKLDKLTFAQAPTAAPVWLVHALAPNLSTKTGGTSLSAPGVNTGDILRVLNTCTKTTAAAAAAACQIHMRQRLAIAISSAL